MTVPGHGLAGAPGLADHAVDGLAGVEGLDDVAHPGRVHVIQQVIVILVAVAIFGALTVIIGLGNDLITGIDKVTVTVGIDSGFTGYVEVNPSADLLVARPDR